MALISEGINGGQNPQDARSAASAHATRDALRHVGSRTVWAGIGAVIGFIGGFVFEQMLDEGGVDTWNDVYEIAAFTAAGAVLGIAGQTFGRMMHEDGAISNEQNTFNGVRA